jgi:hypothetical protein
VEGCSGPKSLLLELLASTLNLSQDSELTGTKKTHNAAGLLFFMRLPTDIGLASTKPSLCHQKERGNWGRGRHEIAASRSRWPEGRRPRALRAGHLPPAIGHEDYENAVDGMPGAQPGGRPRGDVPLMCFSCSCV